MQLLLMPISIFFLLTFERELEDGFQVLGARCGDEDVCVTVGDGTRQTDPQRRRLAPPSRRR